MPNRLALIFFALLLTSCSASRQAPVCLMGSHLGADGYCKSQRAPVHQLPFRNGFVTRVVQGYHGLRTHIDDREGLAIDFQCEEGDPIVASRSGKVLEVFKESRRGCADRSCLGLENFITIDHGDQTFSQYAHLSPYGAIVEPGESVCRGQVIGICGQTGFAGGPHLHYSLKNAMRWTVPVQFLEAVEQKGFGFVAPFATYISKNKRVAQCKEVDFSTIGRGGFAHQGVIMDRPIPLVVDRDNPTSWELRGTYHGDMTHVAVHRKPVDGGAWVDECVRVNDGRFSITLDWNPILYSDPSYFFFLTGSDRECNTDAGWSWSYQVHILGRSN